MSGDPVAAAPLPPLKITCTSTDCDKGLHCFKQTRKMKTANQHGQCRACGADLIDWDRVKRHDITDIDYAFRALKFEFIRHHFWHVKFDQKAINHALRKGLTEMRIAAEMRIRKSVGPAEPGFDGRQTPKEGNVLFYAQHATASCCRKCIEEWHGFPKGYALTEEQIVYLSGLVVAYVEERMPDLPEHRQKVPALRQILASQKS